MRNRRLVLASFPLALFALLAVLLPLGGSNGALSRQAQLDDPLRVSDDDLFAAAEQAGLMEFTAAERRAVERDPTGGKAVVYRPSGERVTGRARASVPEARLYETGVHGYEPTLAVDDEGRIFYLGFDTNAFPVSPTEVVRSTDEGETWERVTPSVDGQSRHPTSEDPYLHMDEDTGRVFMSDFLLPCHAISSSDDAGDTWTSTVTSCDVTDHQTLFTGPPVTSPTIGYPNIVYYCGISGGLANYSSAAICLKSLNGGVTFIETGEPAYVYEPVAAGVEGMGGHGCTAATGHGVAGPDGAIYLPKGYCGQPFLAISHDEGLTWSRVQIADNGMSAGLKEDHDAAVAVDDAGNIYYSWSATDNLPYLSVSQDGGDTWSEPVMIAPPGVKLATLIAIDVTSPGNLAVGFVGSEKSQEFGDNHYNGYMLQTNDALSSDPLIYAGTVNNKIDPIESWCAEGSCRVNREFIDVAIGPDGTPWVSFSDGCYDGSCDHTGELFPLGTGRGIVGRLVGGPTLRPSNP